MSKTKREKKKSPSWSCECFWSLFSICFVVLISYYTFRQPNANLQLHLPTHDSRTTAPLSSTISISKEVNTLEWTDDRISLLSSEPTVISGGPGVMWTDLSSQWNMDNLMGTSNEDKDENSNVILAECRVHSKPLFVLERERDEGGMIGGASRDPVRYRNITLLEFSRHLGKEDGLYYYWTGEMSAFSTNDSSQGSLCKEKPASLTCLKKTNWEKLQVIEPLLQTSLQNQSPEFWEPMLWLSQAGVVAQTHYDTQHNFFTVIFGVRRFTFFPPNMEMHPFPNLHRSNRQSQLFLENEKDAEVFNELSSYKDKSDISVLQIELGPGDTLYIPPYWYHRVESLTPSLGVSVSSPSALEALLQQAFWRPVPLGSFQTISQRKSATKLYLTHLVERVCQLPLKDYALELYHSRFSFIYPPAWIKMHDAGFECTEKKADDDIISKFSLTASEIASIIDNSNATAAVKKIFIGDYIEQIMRWAVGPREVIFYLYHCLAA